MKNFSDKFLRGISTRDGVENEIIANSAMSFDTPEKTGRIDNFDELSITFNECHEALDTIKKQMNNGKLQFVYGIVEFSTTKFLDNILGVFVNKQLNIEKRGTPENKYHGNVLMASNLNNTRKNHFRGILGMCQTRYIKNDEHE